MIYLIRSYIKNGSLLKIGYTEDGNEKIRLSQYLYHNPGIEILHKIPLGTLEHESKLHYKFRHLKYEKLNEWFKDEQEIINYINLVSLQDLDLLPEPILTSIQEIKKRERGWRKDLYYLDTMIGNILRKFTLENTNIDIKRLKAIEQEVIENTNSLQLAFEYIISKPEFSSISLSDYSSFTTFTDNFNNIVNELNKINSFPDKIKKCCQYINEGYGLNFIPEPFKMYIQTLGVDYIISVGGQKSKLDFALNSRTTERIFTSEDLKEVVIKYFESEPNKRWSKVDIKSTLGEIYKQLGIAKKAKASDLEEWFELKRISVVGNSGKRIDGFEIIKKKY